MKTIKGFDSNLKCRGFQYEIGKTYYQEGEIKLCSNGFHALNEEISPLTLFKYYPPVDENGTLSHYCNVEAEGDIDKSEDKIACSKITIGDEISISEIVKMHVKWVKTHSINEKKEFNTGHQSAAMNSGHQSAAMNTGDYSVATNSGHQSAAMNTGDYSAATNSGNYSAAMNTGDYSAAMNTGDYSAAVSISYHSAAMNTGDYSAAVSISYHSAAMNTGDYSVAMNTGYRSAAAVEGKDSIAITTGRESKAKGALGCAIVVVERGDWNGKAYPLKAICSAIVDGVNIKADTWYTVKNGQFIEL